jgi:hypothetical protein
VVRVIRSFSGIVRAVHQVTRPIWHISLIVAAVAHVEPAEAQTVSGRVTERANGTPLAGVYVYLTTEDGIVSIGGLTDARGLFVLRAPAPGRYELHAELIGHRPSVADSLLLSANSTERRDLAMTVRAIDLAAISVRVENRCRSGPPAAPITAELWEDVRTALRVTQWTQEKTALQFGLVRTRRELDPVTMDVRAEETQTRRGYFVSSPYVALSAEHLAEHGFVTRAGDGSLEYWAPDAAVLLSESFLANHCFRVSPPEASDPHLVGLAFEPVSGRVLPEIEGVLWVDAKASELERLDFRYVNLPFGQRSQWDAVGGRVEFERLGNGMWIVRRWRIRMPIVEMRRRVDGVSVSSEPVLAELNELSGEVVGVDVAVGSGLANAAALTDSLPEPQPPAQPQADAPLAGDVPAVQRDVPAVPPVTEMDAGRVGISGIVSGERGPAVGVAMLLTDSSGVRIASAITNDEGAFRFYHPGTDGVYRLTAEHVGYTTTVHDLALRRGEAISLDVRLATRAVPLGEIRVTARRQDFLANAGFYERMERGLGWFVDPEEIERRKPSRITDILRRAPGVQVISQGAMGADIRLFDSQRLQGDCPPSIYLDGLLARAYPRSGPPITDLVDVATVAAIEVLRRPSEIPSRYRGSRSACGVVLVWLKR